MQKKLKMIKRFMASITSEIELADLSQLNIIGGCLGCIECGFDNRCSHSFGQTEQEE